MSQTASTSSKTALALLVLVLAAAGLLLHADVPQVPSNFWAPAGDMTTVRAGASGTLLPNGLVLVAGGIDANGATANVERFSPDGAHFLSGQPMQAARANHTATLLADGRVLVAGGTGAGGTTEATAEIYDPSGPAWLPAGSLNVARRGHTATRLPDGKVLIAGGDNNGAAIDSLEVFDPATALFTIVDGASIGARTLHAAAPLLDGRVLIAGGFDGTNPLASTSIYDPETNTVSAGPDLSTSRSGLTATTLLDGRVLVAGGAGAGGELASAQIFDPVTNALTATDNSLAFARQNHLAFLLPHNNQVLIVGGLAGGNPVAAAEYFTPWEGANGTFCAQAICASGYQGPQAPANARAWATGSALSFPADKTIRTGPADGLLVLAGGSGQQSSELFGFATVKTDKEDYAPGATVKITGSGWKPHEFVALVLREAPFFDEHPLLDVEADVYGNIISEEFVPDAHDIGIRFYVTAYGEESEAQTTFEDNRNLILLKVAGAGTVTSSVGSLGNSINCNTACTSQTEAFGDNDSVTLTVAPASGFAFTGWVFSLSGGNGPPATPSIGCSTAGTTCTFGMNGNKQEITATFAAAASVSVTVAPSSVAEDGASNLSYTFTRTGSTTNPLTINFSTGGTATGGTDYSQSATGTVTFAAGSATATVTVDPTPDINVEANETVILTVTSGTGYVVGSPSAATGTISNDDTDVTVAVSPLSVAEDGATNLAYTFTRTGVTTGALTASFSVGGSAAFSTDYTQSGASTFSASSGTVAFAAGITTKTVNIDPSADSTTEPDETVVLTVMAGTGYNVGSPSIATGTITNDDTEVSVAALPSAVDEDGAANLIYTFTRTGVTTGALTVNFSVSGTATFASDYSQTGAATFTTSSGTVNFGAGNSTATVTLDPSADGTVELDETAILMVIGGTGYSVGTPSEATGTISNDDTDVSVAVSPLSVTEDGAPNLVYTFTRTGATANALTANFSVGGSATFATDYTQTGAATFSTATGTVSFGAGNSTATVTVDPSVDSTVELDETVILTVTSGAGYNMSAPSAATGTITNDDTDVSVAVSPSAVDEDGATNLTYTFTRTGVTTGALTVNFSVGGTTAFGTDYTQTGAATFSTTTGTVSFGAGNSTATVTVDPSVDSTVELDETVILTVTSGTGYNVGGPSAAIGTITNDDTEVSVAVSPSAVDEDGATNLIYTLTRTGATASALTVNFSVGGTALFGTDYTQTGAATFSTTSGTASFGAGNSTATVTVDPSADTTVESDEAVILTVTSGTGYNVGTPSAATGTITNDDTDVSVAVSPTSVLEDGAANLVYTFTRAGVTSSPLTVSFSVGGSATFATDYTQTGAATFSTTTGTVSFGAGNSTATVTVDPSVDSTVEPDETVVLTLTAGTGYNVIAPDTATGTITNDDTDVSVAVSAASVLEDGATNLVYTFSRAGVTSTPLTVNFLVGGSAAFGTDYSQTGAATFTTTTGTVTFGAGNTTTTVTADPTADSTVEPDETVVLTLTAGTGYNVIAPNTATGTITNDDTDVSVAVSPTSVLEDGAANLVYTFTRAGVTSSPLTVSFSVGGSATFATDYTQTGAATFSTTTGTVSFGAGNSTATVTVDPSVDSTVEPDETVVLALTAGTGYNVIAPDTATGTITNDDTDVSVAVSPASVLEDGAPNLVYTFTRIGVTSTPLTVNFSVGGTADFSTDYTQTGAATFTTTTGTVTFGAGNTTTTVIADPSVDSTVEPDETVILTLTSGMGYNLVAPDTATGTITNDDTDVSVAVSPASVLEDGAPNLVYTFTRVGVTTGALTVNFSVGGTAAFGTDYSQTDAATFTTTTGTVSLGAGNSTATVTVDPSVDTTVEPDETVTLTVTSGTGYNVGTPGAATGTITNDDTDVSVAVSPMSVLEDGAPNLVYTFTRVGVTSTPLTVNFLVGGTADFGTDYTQTGAATFTTTTGTVTFGAGTTTTTVTADPSADTTVETDETVILTLTSGMGYNVVAPATATGTITNDDTDVSVAVSAASVLEDGAPNLVYTFTRAGVTTGALTVNFSVGGTAAFGTDYTQTGAATFNTTTGTVTFGAGNTTTTVAADPSTDTTYENDETVILTLTSGIGYNVSSPSFATGTIENDDAAPTLSINDVNHFEGNSGTTSYVFTVTKTGATEVTATVSFTTADGAAVQPGDYTLNSGSLTFLAAETTKYITVFVKGDSVYETNETFSVNLSAPSQATLADGSGTGTIQNDDSAPTLSIDDVTHSEGNSGTTNYVFTVSKTGATEVNASVTFATANGTATQPSDYTSNSGLLTFLPADASEQITVQVNGDINIEPNEAFTVNLTSPTDATITDGSGLGTINNDDYFTFLGFFTPVENPPVVNVVNAGRAIPLKWQLHTPAGANVQDLSVVQDIRFVQVACQTEVITNPIEGLADDAGSSDLRLVDGGYQFNWKTEKRFANTCMEIRVTLTDGSPAHVAKFRFTK